MGLGPVVAPRSTAAAGPLPDRACGQGRGGPHAKARYGFLRARDRDRVTAPVILGLGQAAARATARPGRRVAVTLPLLAMCLVGWGSSMTRSGSWARPGRWSP